MSLIKATLVLLLGFFASQIHAEQKPAPIASSSIEKKREQLKEEIQRSALSYFIDQTHPVTGLVKDKVNNFGKITEGQAVASIASTGFGLAVISHASTLGWVDPKYAKAYCARTLSFVKEQVGEKDGWLIHWLDWENGTPVWNSEYSTIDTGLFISGALYAASVFPESTCAKLAQGLYERINFQAALTNGGKHPEKKAISMGYNNGEGWSEGAWDMFAEQRFLILLGLGHPKYPLPKEAWLAFPRQTEKLADSGEKVMGLKEALFVHQYSELFIDFRQINDGFLNYHKNGKRISRYHRRMAKTLPKIKTLKEGFWGFSAGETATGYSAYSALKFESQVCPSCAVGSAMFLGPEVLDDFIKWRARPDSDKIWGRYGFIDGLDLDKKWYSKNVIAISVGAAYMSMANLDYKNSFWSKMMKIPALEAGIKKINKQESLLKVAL